MNINRKKIGQIRNNENTNNNCIDLLHTKRRMDWTREWLKRSQFGHYEQLMSELRVNEIYHFNNFFKMTEKQFRFLIEKLSPQITQQEPQRKKKAFTAEERLAITLKYLATGEIHSCRQYGFRATQNVILAMVADICLKIYENLKDEYLKFPTTVDEWREISKGFYDKCKLPNCIGALEGRHIAFRPTKKPNPRNYGFYDESTIVLMAIVDSDSNFIFVDVGTQSNLNDSGIFNRSLLKQSLDREALSIPKTDILPYSEKSIPSFLVGSYSFPLKSYLMKPFYVSHLTDDQLYFDFKMWDVSRRAENCFETLTNTFPILLEPFKLDIDNARKVTLGCIALYNYLRKTSSSCNVINIDVDEDDDDDQEVFQKSGCLLKFNRQGQDDENILQQRDFLMEYINCNRYQE